MDSWRGAGSRPQASCTPSSRKQALHAPRSIQDLIGAAAQLTGGCACAETVWRYALTLRSTSISGLGTLAALPAPPAPPPPAPPAPPAPPVEPPVLLGLLRASTPAGARWGQEWGGRGWGMGRRWRGQARAARSGQQPLL